MWFISNSKKHFGARFLLRACVFGVLCDYKYSSYGVQKFAVWNFFKYFDILPKVNTKPT